MNHFYSCSKNVLILHLFKLFTKVNTYHLFQICSVKFWGSSQLVSHMSQHTESEGPFECFICKKHFEKFEDFESHLQEHKEPGLEIFKCDHCGKTFRSGSNLRNHLNVHTGLKPHACGTCGRAFANQRNLKRHERAHTGIKPYTCEICNKKFNATDNFARYVKEKFLFLAFYTE